MSRAIYNTIYSGVELILQPFRHFTYVTTHSQTLPSLYLRHSSFSNPSVASPTSQICIQCYIQWSRAHSPIFPSLHLRHNSFSDPSVALPTSQLILQPFRCFTYVIAHSPTFLSLLLRHRLFTYVTWRAAHGKLSILCEEFRDYIHRMFLVQSFGMPSDT